MSDSIELTKPDEAPETTAEDLAFARGVRRRVVDALADSAITSKDPETLNIVLKAVDGLDKSALTQLKLAQKEKENKTRENEAEVLSRALIQLANQRAGAPTPEPQHSNGPSRQLDPEAKPTFNEDLLSETASGENYNEFKDRMGS